MVGDVTEMAAAEVVEAEAAEVTQREDQVAVGAAVVVVDKGSAGMRRSQEVASRLTALSAIRQAPTIQNLPTEVVEEEDSHNISSSLDKDSNSSRLSQQDMGASLADFKDNNSRILVRFLSILEVRDPANMGTIATNSSKVSAPSTTPQNQVKHKTNINRVKQHQHSSLELDSNNNTLQEARATNSVPASATWSNASSGTISARSKSALN